MWMFPTYMQLRKSFDVPISVAFLKNQPDRLKLSDRVKIVNIDYDDKKNRLLVYIIKVD